MKSTHHLASLLLVLFSALAFLAFTGTGNKTDDRIAYGPDHLEAYLDYMMDMDMFTLRLIRATQDEDMERIEEVASQLKRLVDSFVVFFDDGMKDIQLTKDLMVPALERLETKVETRNMEDIRLQAGVVIAGCNACHTLTGVRHLEIENPFFKDNDSEEN